MRAGVAKPLQTWVQRPAFQAESRAVKLSGRQASLQKVKQDGDRVWSPERLAMGRNMLRPLSVMLCITCRQWMSKGISVRNRSRRNSHILVLNLT